MRRDAVNGHGIGWLHTSSSVTHSRTDTPPAQASKASQIESIWKRHRVWLIVGVLGALVFCNYVSTLAPTVLSRDSGRFQARAYVLGIGHPTGYPTYIMLGKLFTYLPVGDVAYRVNLSSAVYATVATVLLFFLARRLAGTLPAVIAALSLAVSRTFWSQSLIAEVYTLHVLFLCATLMALLQWEDTRKDRYLLLTAFLAGLAMTNHLTSGLLLPATALFVLLSDRGRLRDWRLLARCALLFLLGLLPYLYIPIRASMNPPLNYGDASNLHNFLRLVTGQQFRERMWAFGPAELPARLKLYGTDLLGQFHLVFLALALLGVGFGLRRHRSVTAFLATLFTGQLFYALEYDIPDIADYFTPTHLVIAVFMALGVRWLLMIVRRTIPGRLQSAATVGLSLVLLLLVAPTWQANYTQVDQSGNYEARDLIERVARVPHGAVIYDTSNTTPLQYLRFVERRRSDLRVRQVRVGNVERALSQDLRAGRKVYFLHRNYRRLLEDRYDLRPEDGLWRVVQRVPGYATRAAPARPLQTFYHHSRVRCTGLSPGPSAHLVKLVIVALKSAPREKLTHHGAPLTYVAVSPSRSLSLLPRDSPSPGARVRMLAPPAKGSSGTVRGRAFSPISSSASSGLSCGPLPRGWTHASRSLPFSTT